MPSGPGGGTSQHNGNSMRAGDNWIGQAITALQQSPDWSSTAVFITYDDESTTALKTTYVMKNRGFGGMFMWELSGDYDGQSQTLLQALYDAWKGAR